MEHHLLFSYALVKAFPHGHFGISKCHPTPCLGLYKEVERSSPHSLFLNIHKPCMIWPSLSLPAK